MMFYKANGGKDINVVEWYKQFEKLVKETEKINI